MQIHVDTLAEISNILDVAIYKINNISVIIRSLELEDESLKNISLLESAIQNIFSAKNNLAGQLNIVSKINEHYKDEHYL